MIRGSIFSAAAYDCCSESAEFTNLFLLPPSEVYGLFSVAVAFLILTIGSSYYFCTNDLFLCISYSSGY